MANNARQIINGLIAAGMTKADIGRAIGYSRSAVSLYADGLYGSVEKIEAAILCRFDRVTCPHLQRDLSPTECAGFANRACPTSIAREVRHWKTCQTCPNKPAKEASDGDR